MLHIGHRGLMNKYPANSLEAFAACFFQEEAVHGIECDVRSSEEGTQVIFHDKWINGKRVDDTSLHQLKFQGVPTLEDLLDLGTGSDKLLDIELKGDANPQEVAQLIRQYHTPDEQLLISSFHLDLLRAFHEELPNIRIGLICGLIRSPLKWGKRKPVDRLPGQAIRNKALRKLVNNFPSAKVTLIPHVKTLSLELATEAQGLNVPLLSWGVQSQKERELAMMLNIQGVIVDDM